MFSLEAGNQVSRWGADMGVLSEDDRRAQLTRAVIVSLLSWRRAAPDDALDDDQRYGWWGDSLPQIAGGLLGSRLWLLRRAALTDDTVVRADFYAREALAWLVDDGQVLAVDIALERRGLGGLMCRVMLTLDDGEVLPVSINDLWGVQYAV